MEQLSSGQFAPKNGGQVTPKFPVYTLTADSLKAALVKKLKDAGANTDSIFFMNSPRGF